MLILRSSKTHTKNQKPVKVEIKPDGDEDFDPIEIIQEFTNLRDNISLLSEQFFVFKGGQEVKATHFRSVLKFALERSGFANANYNCHSLRIGRARDLKKQNWTISAIKEQGRWKSSAIFKYLF